MKPAYRVPLRAHVESFFGRAVQSVPTYSVHFKERYSVIGQLGKGTFGRVVEMFDSVEKRAVAVKVVRAVDKCAASQAR